MEKFSTSIGVHNQNHTSLLIAIQKDITMGCCLSSAGPQYDDYDWVELPSDARQAAETLGYTKKIWDKGKATEYEEYDWEDLPDEQKQAASVLGYDEVSWNK